jgi:hypothetical protein
MIKIDMLDDPRNWTSNTEWSNFYWANNVLGIYKIISDRLLYKLNPEIIELYRSHGYLYSSSNAIGRMEILNRNNLLLDREFSTSIWLVVDNYDDSTYEKLHVILNREKFEMTYNDYSDNTEKIEIPYNVEESADLFNLKIELNEIRSYTEKLELFYKASDRKDDKIKDKLDNLKLKHQNIYTEYIQVKERQELPKNQIIDLSYWGDKIKKMLLAELPELDDNMPKTGYKYHVIDIEFQGTVKIEISDKIK